MAEEKNTENKIKKYLASKGHYHFKVFGGGIFGRAGIPDIICCINGKFVAFEVKSSIGTTSKLQEYHIAQIKKSGGLAFVVRSLGEVMKILEQI